MLDGDIADVPTCAHEQPNLSVSLADPRCQRATGDDVLVVHSEIKVRFPPECTSGYIGLV